MKPFFALLAFALAATAATQAHADLADATAVANATAAATVLVTGQRIVRCQNERYQVQIFGEIIQTNPPSALYSAVSQDLPAQGGEIRQVSQNLGYFRTVLSATTLQDLYRDQQGLLSLTIRSDLVTQSGTTGYAAQFTGVTGNGQVFGDPVICQLNGNLFPTVAPTINTAGTKCDDNHCVWIQGMNFTPAVRVEIRRKALGPSSQPIAVIQPLQIQHDPVSPLTGISFPVPPVAVSTLENEGFLVSVVTPDGYTSGVSVVRMPFTGVRWSGKFDLAYRITLTYEASTGQGHVTSQYLGGQQGMSNEKVEFFGSPIHPVKTPPRVFATRIVDGKGQANLSQQPVVMDALGSWVVAFDLQEQRNGVNTLGIEVELQY